eukprot:SAG11_NODE_8171_length_1052_cov_2.499475_1_plen_76_part_00
MARATRSPPYTRYVDSAGRNLTYGTRERPMLLFEAGVPTALYTAVTYPNTPNKLAPTDASFVLMQSVRTVTSAMP